jgi:hypothetical protein
VPITVGEDLDMDRSHQPKSAFPTFQSVQEAAEFWDTHSTTEFEDDWAPVDVEVARPLERTWLVSIELDETSFERLRAIAKRRGVGADELAKQWLLDRLARVADSNAAD